ncbi:MAG: c-type cytochrome [Alphaproteobacteria bacterium]|nr:c-type cytochrome [Alphaproteobacteria bacterium]
MPGPRPRLPHLLLGAAMAAPLALGVPLRAEPETHAVEPTAACVSCHGLRGEGRSALDAPRIGGLDAAYVERQLMGWRLGHRDGGVDGVGDAMAALARGLRDDEAVKALAVAVSKQQPPALPPTPAVKGGAEAYTPCAACHGAAAEGVAALHGPALRDQDPAYLRLQLQAFRDGQRGTHPEDTYGQQMAALAAGLDDATIDLLVAHIGALRPPLPEPEPVAITASREEGLAAFADIHAVSTHPRCMNCHPAGDAPLQTDASTPHIMGITRFSPQQGQHCSTCHAVAPVGDGQAPLPPADSLWNMPPAEMGFQGRTAAELCAQLTDPTVNGYRTPTDLAAHVEEDHLLITSWRSGRTPPPLSHPELVERFRTWAAAGAPCPE